MAFLYVTQNESTEHSQGLPPALSTAAKTGRSVQWLIGGLMGVKSSRLLCQGTGGRGIRAFNEAMSDPKKQTNTEPTIVLAVVGWRYVMS